jgi:hypothetical protein
MKVLDVEDEMLSSRWLQKRFDEPRRLEQSQSTDQNRIRGKISYPFAS